MSQIKGIPLRGGLITNSDLEDVEEKFSSDLVNVDWEKPGALTIRKPIGDVIRLPRNSLVIYRWFDKIIDTGMSLEPLWVSLSTINQELHLYTSTDGSTWIERFVVSHWDIDPQIIDLGGSLRLNTGWSNPIYFIDFISRKFFNNKISFNDYYFDDDASPSPSWGIQSVASATGGMLTADKYFFYKLVPVYDGLQIGALDKTLPLSVQTDSSKKMVEIQVRVEKNNFNPRTTAMNLYRASNTIDNPRGSTYYLINVYPTWSMEEDYEHTRLIDGLRYQASLGDGNMGDGVCSVGSGTYTTSGTCTGASGTWTANSGNVIKKWYMLLTGLRGDSSGTLSSASNFTNNSTKTQISRTGHNNQAQTIRWREASPEHEAHQGSASAEGKYVQRYEQGNWDYNSNTRFNAKGPGSSWRTVESIHEAYVKTFEPFWKETNPSSGEWHEIGFDMDEAVSNNTFSSDNGNVKNAIISNKNQCRWSASFDSLWSSYNSSSATNCYTIDLGYDNGVGSYSNKPFRSMYFKSRNGSSTGEEFKRVVKVQGLSLTQNTWYFITFSCTNGSGTSGSAGLGISNNNSWPPNETWLFKGTVEQNNMLSAGWEQHGWWYYHTASTGSYHCQIGNLTTQGSMPEGYTHHFQIKMPGVFEVMVGPTGVGYFGTKTIVVPQNFLAPTTPAKSLATGDSVHIANEQTDTNYVVASAEVTNYEMCKLEPQITVKGSKNVTLAKNFTLTETAEYLDLKLTDIGWIDGEQHPIADVSTATRYKVSKMLNGRLFVGNVMLQPATFNTEEENQEPERHPNWIMFSEFNNPDVIPVTNYLAVNDLGEGEITAFAELTGNLIVFSSHRIYRLNIPSYDPTQWSLMETSQGLGVNRQNNVVNVLGNVIFGSPDNLYLIDSSFIPKPITTTIRDVYQDLYTEGMKLHFDTKSYRLFLIFQNLDIYCLHLNRYPTEEVWQRIVFCRTNMNSVANNPKDMFLDEHFQTRLLFDTYADSSDIVDGTWSNDPAIVSLDPKNNITETVGFVKSTGWMRLSTPDMSVMIRKFHIRYKASGPIQILFHTDFNSLVDELPIYEKNNNYANDSVKIKASSGTDTYYDLSANCDSSGKATTTSKLSETIRLGIRCHSLKVTIRSGSGSTDFVEIYSMELEHE